MRYLSESRLRERRGQKSIQEWTEEWKQKLENWNSLSEREQNLVGTSAMKELSDIIELGIERTRLKLKNQ
jgi:hypothetical protein